jgi:hypothetical protein
LKTFFLKKAFAIGCFLALAFSNAHAQNYFRSVASGNWNATSTWQMSPDNITWGAASTIPNNTDNTVTIQSPNTVTITGTASVTIDEVVVNTGGTLINAITGAGILTYNDGAGIDLSIFGTFIENQTNSIAWTASATWVMGTNGTLIRTQNTSSNFWQQRYNGGISTIPSTANWIIRKTGGANPSISTTAGIGGAYYPNLTIENNVAGIWTTATSSTFTGSTAFPTIKGNFDIGGSGTSTVNFLNQHTNATPTRVLGNFIVKTGNILSNYGTGLEVQGNVTVNGTLQYDANDLRTLDFSGGIAQTFSGTGTAGIWNMRMMKTANNLTLSRAIKVDNALTLTAAGIGGKIFSTAANLITIEDNATASGATNTSYVDGPLRKLGDEAFTFPVGKNSFYRLIKMSIATGPGGGIFWTESFNSGCTSLCQANTYSGPNGAWTITDLGPATQCGAPVTANTWYVSCAESGTGPGSCGTTCGGTGTLHVGNISSSPSAPFFCPTGDCGASYDAGGYCGLLGSTPSTATDKRAESPAINCTGQSGISVSFNYMEFGDGTNDNATLWYYDGSAWSQIDDMPKTACCGGTCNGSLQGKFTARTVALPASANNNANIKIAFRWVNDDDGTGTDPSFAVDDVTLGTGGGIDSYTAEYFRANPQVVYNNIVNAPLNHISQCEYWTLVRNNGTQARSVELSWDGNSCGVTNLSDLRVAYFNGASWDDKGNGGTTGTLASGTVITATTVNNFGPFTLASVTAQNPLPVYLIDFSATPQGNDVLLEWVTSSEINNDRFEILSSDNSSGANNFEEISQVKGSGNSTSIHRYSYLDQRPAKKGTYYYRLRQVDFDGSQMLSNIVAVNFRNGKSLNLVGIIPNPFTDRTSVQIYSSERGVLSARITDVFGREISAKEFAIDKGMFSFDPEESARLSSGIYFVELILNDERIVSRLVKE